MSWSKKQGWYGKQLDQHILALKDVDISRIPWIFCGLAEEHDPSKLAAARALNSALACLIFDDVILTDGQMR